MKAHKLSRSNRRLLFKAHKLSCSNGHLFVTGALHPGDKCPWCGTTLRDWTVPAKEPAPPKVIE